MKADRSYPFAMKPCSMCGEMPRLVCHRDGTWSVTCPHSHGDGERSASKAAVCELWNLFQITGGRSAWLARANELHDAGEL